MDARSVLQENVSTALIVLVHQLECSQVDELAGVEDDLQVGVANKHEGNSTFDQVDSRSHCEKQ